VIVPKFRWALVNKVPGPELHWFFGSLQKYYSGKRDAANMLPEDVNYMLYAHTHTHTHTLSLLSLCGVGVDAGSIGAFSKFKHLFRRWVFFLYPWVSVCSAEAAKDVLQTATPKGEAYNRIKPWLGEGLLIATGKRWFKHRRMLTPAFHFNVLKGFVDIYSVCCVCVCARMQMADQGPPQKHAAVMLDQWQHLGSESVDLQKWIHNLTLVCIGCANHHPHHHQH
jgi:hypothetical protein